MATQAPATRPPNGTARANGDGRPVAVHLSDETVPELVGRLVDDTRGVVSAEVELYKAKISERVAAYKGAAIFFGAAGVVALLASIGLVVGLIMMLASLIGPGLATLVVVGLLFAVAAVLGLVGRGKLAPPKTGAPR